MCVILVKGKEFFRKYASESSRPWGRSFFLYMGCCGFYRQLGLTGRVIDRRYLKGGENMTRYTKTITGILLAVLIVCSSIFPVVTSAVDEQATDNCQHTLRGITQQVVCWDRTATQHYIQYVTHTICRTCGRLLYETLTEPVWENHSFTKVDMGHHGSTHRWVDVCECEYAVPGSIPCNGPPCTLPE